MQRTILSRVAAIMSSMASLGSSAMDSLRPTNHGKPYSSKRSVGGGHCYGHNPRTTTAANQRRAKIKSRNLSKRSPK